MSNQMDDYLWDPHADPDSEIVALERALRPYGTVALQLAERRLPDRRWQVPIATRQPLRWIGWTALATAAAIAGIWFAGFYRLSWTEGSPWPATVTNAVGATHLTQLQVGDQLTTESGQLATFNAARIGKVVITENSAVRLVQTRTGKHRIELEHGHMHAKIWAPPGYFGVETREASIIDLGCEFDLSVDASGNGIVAVQSGWVNFEFQGMGLWVPERYAMKFTAIGPNIPLRFDVSEEFRAQVDRLENLLASASQESTVDLERQIALAAHKEDYATLFMLLRHHPSLAGGPLYPRLASVLGAKPDEEHRQRLIRGDRSALSEWWQYLPRQPKQPRQWWQNWRDAF